MRVVTWCLATDMSLFAELNRRNVFRVGVAYVATGWLLIQVAETIFPLFGYDDSPARIVVVVLAIGFFPTLVLAWVFELTPEGLKKDEDVDRSTPATPRFGQRLDRGIIVLLVLGIGYFAFDKFVLSESREASIAEQARQEGRTEALIDSRGETSIAVLPFDDMSPEKNQVHLSDGIAEQLLNLLAGIPELRVISRTSAFSYKGQDFQVAQIAEELGVSHVLEGSVQKSGDRVRISVQLVDARSDTQVWTSTFDRTLEDIFVIQDEIAAAVVENLRIELLGEAPTVRPSDLEAYTLFLQAAAANDSEEAIRLLTEAVTIDPLFAQGWAQLANTQLYQTMAGRVEPLNGFITAAASANTALGLDPNNVDAMAVIGSISIFRDRDLVAAAQYLQSALQRAPGHTRLLNLHTLLNLYFGRLQQALDLTMKIIDRDPLEASGWVLAANILVHLGRPDEAQEMLARILVTRPELLESHDVNLAMGRIEIARGNPGEALAYIGDDQGEYGRTLAACALHDLGRSEDSDAVIEELQSRTVGFYAWATALAYGCRGDVDNTLEWIERSIERREALVILLRAAPEFIHLHGLPRWESLLDRLGVSDVHAASALAAVE